MSDDSVPGLWSDHNSTIVLAKVAYAFWGYATNSQSSYCFAQEPGQFERLYIVFDGGTRKRDSGMIMTIADKDQALSFLRALALYWETRS